MTDRLAELSAAGVAVWLDDISRERLVTRRPGRSCAASSTSSGVTTNPTIFAKALAEAATTTPSRSGPGRCAGSPSRRRPA